MRICIDVSQTVYEGTGSGRYVIELIKALLGSSLSDELVLFGSAGKKRDGLQKLTHQYFELDTRQILTTKYFPLPPRVLELIWNSLHIIPIEFFTGHIDVYHSSDWTQATSRAKKVTTVHDMIPFLFPEHVHPRIRRAHELRWKHILADGVSIIVDALSTKQDVLKVFPSLHPDSIHVIPLGCGNQYFDVGRTKFTDSPTELYSHQLHTTLSQFSLVPGNYILSVGTLEPRKNIQRLITAYLSMDESIRKSTPLVIVGKKAWGNAFAQKEGVTFTGYVEESDLPYLYAGARCFVMPSLYEGFGIPVLEAMAAGTPVICSQRSSLPEIGGNDVHYIQDPESTESIRMILQHVLTSDTQELQQVARNAYTRAQLFTWHSTAQKTLEVYHNL